MLSPFSKVKNTTWIEGDVDNTSYELSLFCKETVHGSATHLEVFFSDVIADPDTDIAQRMRANWCKFIDTDKFVMASRGYAQSQYNKMSLFDPDKRTPKFAVAYCRVLWQCSEFLRTGTFPCKITDHDLRQFLLEVKNDWSDSYVKDLSDTFQDLQAKVTRNWAKAERMTPDIPWIEDFIYWAYTKDL